MRRKADVSITLYEMVVCFIDIADGCLLRCFGVGWWGGVGICAVLGRKSGKLVSIAESGKIQLN